MCNLNNLIPIIASMSLGGIIGYSTNWIAIKMLFKPLREVRIFNIRVPFTPGVVPRQRHALGTSIGETIENHILTKESLSDTVHSEQFQRKLSYFLKTTVSSLNKNGLTISQQLKKNNVQKRQLVNFLSTTTLNNRTIFVKVLRDFCDLFVKKARSTPLKTLVSNNSFQLAEDFDIFIQENISAYIEEINYKYSEQDLKIRDVLNSDYKNMLEAYVENNLEEAVKFLAVSTNSHFVKQFISKSLEQFLSESFFGNIVKSFVSNDTLTQMTLDSIQSRLEDPETLKEIRDNLPAIFEKVYNIDVGKITDFIASQKLVISPVISSLVKDFIGSLLSSNKEKLLGDILDDLGIDMKMILDSYIVDKFIVITSDIQRINQIIDPIIEKILDTKVSFLFQLVENYSDKIVIFLCKLFTGLLANYGDDILNALDVKRMVENQVDRLDLLDVEEIILGVMNNQLKAITWFGLLLGALLGLLIPYINMLLS